MPLVILLIVIGVILLESALKGQSVVDILKASAGAKKLDPQGTPFERLSGAVASVADAAIEAVSTVGGSGSGPAGTSVPNVRWNPHKKPIANWIVKNLEYAAAHGWTGIVNSGYRTAAEQQAAATNYGLGNYPSGPQASNHRKFNYPGGAVDVTEPEKLDAILVAGGPTPRLVWSKHSSNAVDTVHFSATGN